MTIWVWIPSPQNLVRAACYYKFKHWGGGGRRLSPAHWSPSLPPSVSSRFPKRPPLNQQRGEWLRKTSACSTWICNHVRMRTSTHPHKLTHTPPLPQQKPGTRKTGKYLRKTGDIELRLHTCVCTYCRYARIQRIYADMQGYRENIHSVSSYFNRVRNIRYTNILFWGTLWNEKWLHVGGSRVFEENRF